LGSDSFPKKGAQSLNKNSLLAAVLLTAVWSILQGSLSIQSVAVGITFSVICLLICQKHLPPLETQNISIIRLGAYLLYLLGQVYVGGLYAIKLILTGKEVEIVQIKTSLKNPFLKVLLVNSITFVPGSVSLDLKGDQITVLWLRQKTDDPEYLANSGELIKGKLERMLLKVQE
jgi:multicomponent Na+:H+ antiporter subunit E